jgi:hypothetical protein
VLGRRKSKLNPDFPTDPVRAHSYDVNDSRAKPGQRIGDGSAGYGWAFTEALINAAREIVREHRRDGYEGPHLMQRSYVNVLEAVLSFLTYSNGELNVPYSVIAEKAVVSIRLAKTAVAALEHWGLINHVRRSEKAEGAEGKPIPQRKQASNSYYFDCRRRMASELWQKFWSRVVFNLKRVGAAAARRAVLLKHTFNEVAKQAPRATGELGQLLASIERKIDERDAALAMSASSKNTHYPELQA